MCVFVCFLGVPELGCGSPPQVKHADIQFSSTTPGSVAAYVCHPGFIAVPRATQSICGIQGDWSQPAVCEGPHNTVTQTHILITTRVYYYTLTFNSVTLFNCDFGPVVLSARRQDFQKYKKLIYALLFTHCFHVWNMMLCDFTLIKKHSLVGGLKILVWKKQI